MPTLSMAMRRLSVLLCTSAMASVAGLVLKADSMTDTSQAKSSGF
jgi:hypothetical protein